MQLHEEKAPPWATVLLMHRPPVLVAAVHCQAKRQTLCFLQWKKCSESASKVCEQPWLGLMIPSQRMP